MSHKKKKKRKKSRPSTRLSPHAEATLSTLLSNLADLTPHTVSEKISTPEMAQALVENLPPHDPDAVRVLLAVRDTFPQKYVQKGIKKTVFRFRQKGVTHPDLEPEEGKPVLIRREELGKPTAYVGPVDGTGSRGIFLTLQRVPKGMDVGMGVASDDQGIVEFLYGRYSRKRMREVRDLFFSNFQQLVETTIAHAATILEKAYARNEAGLNDLSKDYLQLRPWIQENISLLEQPPAYDMIPPEKFSAESLTDSQIQKLIGHEFMKTWMVLDEEKMAALLKEIQEAKESPIMVSDVQRAERINEIKAKAVHEIYVEEKRGLIKDRLAEMAYFFYKIGEEEMARLSLATAASFEEKDSIFQVNPFLHALMERSFAFYEQMTVQPEESQDKETDPSGIITP